MLINGVDISVYNATYLEANWGDTEVTTYGNWLDGAYQPNIYKQEVKYTNLDLKLLIEANNPAILQIRESELSSALTNTVITFEWLSMLFEGYLEQKSTEKINKNAEIVTYSLRGTKLAVQQSYTITDSTERTINFSGNCEVPCEIEIELNASSNTIPITINDVEYRITGLSGKDGKILKIDSYIGYITVDGNTWSDKLTPFEFPTVHGGDNTIKVGGYFNRFTIKSRGRWQ